MSGDHVAAISTSPLIFINTEACSAWTRYLHVCMLWHLLTGIGNFNFALPDVESWRHTK
jgi:hypothetical protein